MSQKVRIDYSYKDLVAKGGCPVPDCGEYYIKTSEHSFKAAMKSHLRTHGLRPEWRRQ